MLQGSAAATGGKFEKSSTAGKGLPSKLGVGTAHFMTSLFSESKGFLYLDFQGRWVSSAAALLGNGKSYLVPSKEERTRYR